MAIILYVKAPLFGADFFISDFDKFGTKKCFYSVLSMNNANLPSCSTATLIARVISNKLSQTQVLVSKL